MWPTWEGEQRWPDLSVDFSHVNNSGLCASHLVNLLPCYIDCVFENQRQKLFQITVDMLCSQNPVIIFNDGNFINLVKLTSDEYHWTLPRISEHWFRQWLGAVRHQAITLANVDPDSCGHMVSLIDEELIDTRIRFIYKDVSYHHWTNTIDRRIPQAPSYSALSHENHGWVITHQVSSGINSRPSIVQALKWINNLIPHVTGLGMTYLCCNSI